MEKHKQSTKVGEVEENHKLRDRIRDLEEKLTNKIGYHTHQGGNE